MACDRVEAACVDVEVDDGVRPHLVRAFDRDMTSCQRTQFVRSEHGHFT